MHVLSLGVLTTIDRQKCVYVSFTVKRALSSTLSTCKMRSFPFNISFDSSSAGRRSGPLTTSSWTGRTRETPKFSSIYAQWFYFKDQFIYKGSSSPSYKYWHTCQFLTSETLNLSFTNVFLKVLTPLIQSFFVCEWTLTDRKRKLLSVYFGSLIRFIVTLRWTVTLASGWVTDGVLLRWSSFPQIVTLTQLY